MTFLPLLVRELRVASRRTATYRSRFLIALVAGVIIAALLLGGATSRSPSALGHSLFLLLSGLAFLYACLEGSRVTSDSLAHEKREGTLGLLFLTDLRGYDVVLGKLAATSLRSFFGLLAIFPLLGMCLLAGGVTPGEFWRMLLVLTNTLFLSLTVGLYVSARSWSDRRAWVTSFAMLALLAVPPLLVENMFRLFTSRFHFLFGLPSPLFNFVAALDAHYTKEPQAYWFSLMLIHLLAIGFLLLACRLLPSSWQDPPKQDTPKPNPQRIADSSGQSTTPTPVLETNPVLWFVVRHRGQSRLLWLFVAGAVLIGWLSQLVTGGSAVFWAWSFGVNLIFKIWVAGQACYSMAELRRHGGLELLLTTPLSSDEIWRGLGLAIHKLFLPAFLLLQLDHLVMFFRHSAEFSNDATLQIMPWGFLAGFWALAWSILTVVADLYALATVGLWLGLRDRKPAEALAKTLLYVLFAPSLLCCVPRVITDAAFFAWARMKLREEFRAEAARQTAPTHEDTGWWIFSSKQTTRKHALNQLTPPSH